MQNSKTLKTTLSLLAPLSCEGGANRLSVQFQICTSLDEVYCAKTQEKLGKGNLTQILINFLWACEAPIPKQTR